MNSAKYHIPFTIIYSDEEYPVLTYRGEYRDLRALIADKLFLEDFGQCGGMGRCATCMIEVNGLGNDARNMKRNEMTTLSRARSNHGTVRLSCQIEIDDDLSNVIVKVI